MGNITLITGGSRSGKSSFALRLAEARPGSRLFLATCPVTDKEMELRILRHIQNRRQGNWVTVEEPINLAHHLAQADGYETVLIDCLTLWINNLLYEASAGKRDLDEDRIAELTNRLIEAAGEFAGEVIMVTNEVGLGIVPENRMARIYRDLVGRCNQCVGAVATSVFLVTCGIPLPIKDINCAV